MPRKIVECANCGDEREMAANGLCARCYQQDRRAADAHYVDRHNPEIRKEHERLGRGFQRMIGMFADLRVGKADVMLIRRTLQPYLEPIAGILSPPDERMARDDSERISGMKTDNTGIRPS